MNMENDGVALRTPRILLTQALWNQAGKSDAGRPRRSGLIGSLACLPTPGTRALVKSKPNDFNRRSYITSSSEAHPGATSEHQVSLTLSKTSWRATMASYIGNKFGKQDVDKLVRVVAAARRCWRCQHCRCLLTSRPSPCATIRPPLCSLLRSVSLRSGLTPMTEGHRRC